MPELIAVVIFIVTNCFFLFFIFKSQLKIIDISDSPIANIFGFFQFKHSLNLVNCLIIFFNRLVVVILKFLYNEPSLLIIVIVSQKSWPEIIPMCRCLYRYFTLANICIVNFKYLFGLISLG